MYRRYESNSTRSQPQQSHIQKKTCPPPHNDTKDNSARPKPPPASKQPPKPKPSHPLTNFIPQSVYNPETGKVLGFLSAEDLLIAALILLIIDSGDDSGDNSFLIYALLYVLISDHIDLPF